MERAGARARNGTEQGGGGRASGSFRAPAAPSAAPAKPAKRRLASCIPLLIVLAIAAATAVQPASAYSNTVSYPPSSSALTWQYSIMKAGDDPGEDAGFRNANPFRGEYANRISNGFEIRAFAYTPTSQGGWPNIKYVGNFTVAFTNAYPVSYATWSLSGSSQQLLFQRVPSVTPAYTGYSWLPSSGSFVVGGTSISFTGPGASAWASYGYPNNEFVTDYAETKIRWTFTSLNVVLYRTEVTISASKTSALVGEQIQFTASAKDGYGSYAYSWNFGDGSTSTAQNPTKAYASPGTYTVQCTATDSVGVSDTKTMQVYISSNTATVTFSASGLSADASGTVLTVDGTGYTYSQLPVSFQWTIGSQHTFAYASPVSSTTSGKQYAWQSTGGLSTAQSGTLTAPSGGGTVSATYQTQYRLTVDSASGGTTTPAAGQYWHASGSQVTLTATPNSGYTFAGWTGSGSGSYTGGNNPCTVTMNAPIVQTPSFSAQSSPFDFSLTISPSSLTVSQGSQGSVTCTLTLVSGTPQSVTVTPSWVGTAPSAVTVSPASQGGTPTLSCSFTISASSSASTGSYTLRFTASGGGVVKTKDAAVTISAAQPPPPEYVYLTVSPASGGTTSPAPGTWQYSKGQQVTLTATPNSGYTFAGWTVNGTQWYTTSQITITLNGNTTAAASFSAQPPPPGGNPSIAVFPHSATTGAPLPGARVLAGEAFGLTVTGTVPGVSSPTPITVTAWIPPSPSGVKWYDAAEQKYKGTEYRLTGTTTTNASGWFTITLGFATGVHYAAPAPLQGAPGTAYAAYATVTVGANNYTANGTWYADAIAARASFSYDLTGASAQVQLTFASNGALLTGRAGAYAASIEGVYTASVPGYPANVSRLSLPCDQNGLATLYIPYAEMNQSALRSEARILVWAWAMGTPYALPWHPGGTVTYTTLAPAVYQQNDMCITAEAVDWGAAVASGGASVPPIAGASFALYWDSFAYAFNGTSGLIGTYGPSQAAATITNASGTYLATYAGTVKVDDWTALPPRQTVVAVANNLPSTSTMLQLPGKRELWLQILPPPSEGVLYNPYRDGRVLLAAKA